MKAEVLRCERHAAERFKERYQQPLTDDLKMALLREVKRAVRRLARITSLRDHVQRRVRAESLPVAAWPVSVLWKNTGRRTWKVQLDEQEYRIVVDERQWIIITALPV